MKAIPTLYRGIEYRSRLEARWAAFFANLGFVTTYEPFDGDGYIPDFLVEPPGDGVAPFLVEIKPAVNDADYLAPFMKISYGLRHSWAGDFAVAGVSPWPSCLHGHPPYGETDAGYGGTVRENESPARACDRCYYEYRETHPDIFYCEALEEGLCCDHLGNHDISRAHWIIRKGRLMMVIDNLLWEGDPFSISKIHGMVLDAWSGACNDVKWRGRPVS